MYLNNRNEYQLRIKDNVLESNERIYDIPTSCDKHYIKFTKYDQILHDPVRLAILEPQQSRAGLENNRSNGYSWVEPGTYKPLSKTSMCNSNSQLNL